MKKLLFIVGFLGLSLPVWATGNPPANYFNDGISLYNAGRYSEAMDAFEAAIKHHDRADDSQHYIERIRRETVERIRNQALTGVSKANWQSKYYYIRTIDNQMHVGMSSQELFERQSLNFREGAVDALTQLSDILQHNDNTVVNIDLISEISQDTTPNPDLLAQQLAEVYSYLSLAAQDLLPKFQSQATTEQPK